MLSYSADIKDAHYLKEKLSEWIHIAEISSLEDFRYCVRTLKS